MKAVVSGNDYTLFIDGDQVAHFQGTAGIQYIHIYSDSQNEHDGYFDNISLYSYGMK